jgi:hypothetical protein
MKVVKVEYVLENKVIPMLLTVQLTIGAHPMGKKYLS